MGVKILPNQPKNSLVLNHSKNPFVVSLSNHARGTRTLRQAQGERILKAILSIDVSPRYCQASV